MTYEAMNRDTCINMARELNATVNVGENRKGFAFLSTDKAPPFFGEAYFQTKHEAENYLLFNCPNL